MPFSSVEWVCSQRHNASDLPEGGGVSEHVNEGAYCSILALQTTTAQLRELVKVASRIRRFRCRGPLGRSPELGM